MTDRRLAVDSLRATGHRPRDTRRALWLVLATAAEALAEAGVSLWAASRAGSVALLGFGLDSIIELAASVVLAWRLSHELRGAGAQHLHRVEHRAHRFIGYTFLGLAAYVTVEAVGALRGGRAPATSIPGIVLAAAALVIMPVLAVAKLRVADRLGSRALRAEAKETLACAYLSFALLLGLGAHALLGWGWADPVAALLMVPWLVREGLEGLESDDADDGDADDG